MDSSLDGGEVGGMLPTGIRNRMFTLLGDLEFHMRFLEELQFWYRLEESLGNTLRLIVLGCGNYGCYTMMEKCVTGLYTVINLVVLEFPS